MTNNPKTTTSPEGQHNALSAGLGDDNHLRPGNPGLTAAMQAALAVGKIVVAPEFPAYPLYKTAGFNKQASLAGLDTVCACFFEVEVL